jgi:hypothetical protein
MSHWHDTSRPFRDDIRVAFDDFGPGDDDVGETTFDRPVELPVPSIDDEHAGAVRNR